MNKIKYYNFYYKFNNKYNKFKYINIILIKLILNFKN